VAHCNIVELIRGADKEIKREVPHDPRPERHSLLDRLPVEVRLRGRYVMTVTPDSHLTAP
jgi:hypothetical protein